MKFLSEEEDRTSTIVPDLPKPNMPKQRSNTIWVGLQGNLVTFWNKPEQQQQLGLCCTILNFSRPHEFKEHRLGVLTKGHPYKYGCCKSYYSDTERATVSWALDGLVH